MEYLACAPGDTTRSNPEEAREATGGLFAALAGAYPGGKIHVQVGEGRGWFHLLRIWVVTPESTNYIWLNWSVS
jgi:hypothetical protein